jgi:hypothetical protein
VIYLTWEDFVDRAESEHRLQMFAPGDDATSHPKVDKAEEAAIGVMHGYLRRRGYTLPLDSPLPAEVKEHLLSIAMEFLTMRSENKVDSIDKNARLARTYFKDVSIGHMTIVDLDPSTAAGTESGDLMFSRRTHDFEFDDPTTIGGVRRRPL